MLSRACYRRGRWRLRSLCCSRKAIQHGLLEGEQLLHARPRLDALEMRGTVWKPGVIDAKLHAAPQAPEEVRVGGSEMVEEEFATFEHAVGDFVGFEQHRLGRSAHAFVRPCHVANAR